MSTKKTNKTLTVYTQSGCPACKDIKDVLNKNNINFIEKDAGEEYEKEFDNLAAIIGVWATPTLVYGSHILVSGRDFYNANEVPFTLDVYDNLSFNDTFVTLQRLKTFESNTQQALEYIVETLQKIENREYVLTIKDKQDESE
tara:strand:+ start:395 stop:823 length:429 start_codon:yes stop_codon:yes gene_type:complete